MKLTAGKRVLMFFHWLLSLLIVAAFAVYLIRPDWITEVYQIVSGRLSETQVMIVGIAILAVYVVLAVAQACIIFHRKKRSDRGFITVDSSDTGRVRIAISAIEQMVRQSVTNIDGIADMKIAIESLDDAIGINIASTLQSGCHVPTITVNMQRAIRQFVEMNCGVAVRAVSISINAVSAAAESGRRRGRGKHAESAAPIAPAPEIAAATRPEADNSYAPVPEAPAAAPEPAYAPEPERSAEEYVIPDEPAPIRLTLDPSPAYDYSGADTAEDEAESPASDIDEN